MEEIESPVERTQEDLHEHAHEAKEPWVGKVALTAALLAALAAVAASVSAHHEAEGMLDQLKSSDQWSYYQAKGIKQAIVRAVHPENNKEIDRYEQEQVEIKRDAEREQAASLRHMRVHGLFARCATFAQIGIAIAAVAVLTKRRPYWYVSLLCGTVGLVFFVYGLVS